MATAEGVSASPASTAAGFYFDLASPLAYLAAERVLHVLPFAAEWRGVLAGELGGGPGGAPGGGTSDGGRAGGGVEAPGAEPVGGDGLREYVERRAYELGLQAVRWPEPFPFDSTLAMRAAAYAASIGRAVAFAQAAFRQAFAGGRSLEDPDSVLIAAAACEMHPSAVTKGAQLGSSAERLRRTTLEAARAGVGEVPAVLVGTEVFGGEGSPELAAGRALQGGGR